MKQTIDPMELQRLLDGRMTAEERLAFFGGLEDAPHGWKTVTLAFVEEQVLCDELRAMAADVPRINAEPTKAETSSRRADLRTRRMTQFAVTVFLLTIGVLVGRETMSAKTNSAEVTRREAGRVALPVVTAPSNRKAVPSNRKDNYYVVVTPPAMPQVAAPSQPDADALDLMMTPVFDQRIRDLVRAHGYRVREEPVLYLFQDSKGDQYVIPQRHISLVPEKTRVDGPETKGR